ncbi:MAG: hypothetical protein PHY47_00575 [Lachnospiraceae bacterium]|nr:hypothetical protein [Lachnospiraceae bacterium]
MSNNTQPTFEEEIQFLLDKLNGTDVEEADRYSAWAEANSRIIEIANEEAQLKRYLTKDQKEILQFARGVAQENGARARGSKTLHNLNTQTTHEPLTPVQKMQYDQIVRQISMMKFEDDKPRVENMPTASTSIQRAAKAVKEFGAKHIGLRVGKSEIPYDHPAKNELWKLYYQKLKEIYPPVFEELVAKPSLIEVEAIRLKKLVEKQMPGLITKGSSYGVEVNEILEKFQESEEVAEKLIEDFRAKQAM